MTVGNNFEYPRRLASAVAYAARGMPPNAAHATL